MSIHAFKINYVVTIDGLALSHWHTVRVEPAVGDDDPDVGTTLDNINLRTKGVGGAYGSIEADNGIGDYIEAMCGLYASSMVVNSVALVRYPEVINRNGVYISGANLGDASAFAQLVGDKAVGSNIPAQQGTFNWYNTLGRQGKLILMETASDTNLRQGYGSADAEEQAFYDYITGTTSIVAGVLGSHVTEPANMLTSQNEKLAEKRYRS